MRLYIFCCEGARHPSKGNRSSPPRGKETGSLFSYLFAQLDKRVFVPQIMSVIRSPPGSGLSGGLSGSEPNLSNTETVSGLQNNPNQVIFRNKRKFIDNTKEELSEFREQMLEMMATITANQKEFIDKVCGDISTIKERVDDIKITISNLATEQNKLKLDISKVQLKANATDKKLEKMQSEIDAIKENSISAIPSLVTSDAYESIMTEVRERELRRKNIIIVGIKEPASASKDERSQSDMEQTLKIIKMAGVNTSPEKLFRLGKYHPSKNRPLKVCFKSWETATSILRSKNDVNCDNIKIFSDKTPQQQQFLKNLKDEIKCRFDNGDKNLTIKYIRGVPKIVEIPAKNQLQNSPLMKTLTQ